jgi:hypothetical protein
VCRTAYWTGIVLAAIGTAVAIWRLGPSEVLFPGLLTLFSFSLIWTTQDSRLRKENPMVLVQRGARGLLMYELGLGAIVCVGNPGELAGTLTKIDYRVKGTPVPGMSWSWQSLHPQLASRPASTPRSKLPAPLFPGGLLAVYTQTALDPVQEDAFLHFTFRMGAYRERTMRWRVEPLIPGQEAQENEAATV